MVKKENVVLKQTLNIGKKKLKIACGKLEAEGRWRRGENYEQTESERKEGQLNKENYIRIQDTKAKENDNKGRENFGKQHGER